LYTFDIPIEYKIWKRPNINFPPFFDDFKKTKFSFFTPDFEIFLPKINDDKEMGIYKMIISSGKKLGPDIIYRNSSMNVIEPK
jgi:hypothetical protein